MNKDIVWRCDLVPQFCAYKDELRDAIERVMLSGRYILATEVEAFEKEFTTYVGSPHGIGVNSGTDALLLPLWLLNIQPGDEVITTPFTAIPTYSAIRHVGATPVFVDIEPDTFLLDVGKVKQALSPKTKAVVPVHLFGNAVDIVELRRVVGDNVFILEDCAQSHGAKIHGRVTGSLGDAGAFSYYPTKNLGGYGDGGLITTSRADLAQTMRRRRMYGMINKDEFVMDGVNTRLDELQAAILRVKLRHLDAMNNRRRELAALYGKLLDPQFITPQAIRPGVESVFHVYSVRCKERRDELLAHLERNGIQANIYYPKPTTRQVAYQNAFSRQFDLPATEAVCRDIIALPFYPEIPESIVSRVADTVNSFFKS